MKKLSGEWYKVTSHWTNDESERLAHSSCGASTSVRFSFEIFWIEEAFEAIGENCIRLTLLLSASFAGLGLAAKSGSSNVTLLTDAFSFTIDELHELFPFASTVESFWFTFWFVISMPTIESIRLTRIRSRRLANALTNCLCHFDNIFAHFLSADAQSLLQHVPFHWTHNDAIASNGLTDAQAIHDDGFSQRNHDIRFDVNIITSRGDGIQVALQFIRNLAVPFILRISRHQSDQMQIDGLLRKMAELISQSP